MPSRCCKRKFQDSGALEQHKKAKHFNHCKSCNRSFDTDIGLKDHNRDRHGHSPSKDKKSPNHKPSIGQVRSDSNRHQCSICQKAFADRAALMQHLQSGTHAVEFRCCDCERDFVSLEALNQHLKDKVHKPKVSREVAGIHKCQKCTRQFRSNAALQDHTSSGIHDTTRKMACATSGGDDSHGCQRRFKSPSAVLHHLESGTCSSGMDRAKLNMLVLVNDTEAVISSPESSVQALLHETTRRLGRAITPGSATPRAGSSEAILTATSSSSSRMSQIILTPTSSTASWSLASPILTPKSIESGLVSSAFLKQGNRCPLCPPSRRPFSTPQSLQQHLQSPAHDAQIFHCPVSIFASQGSVLHGKAAVKWFSTISGMAQHVESGACIGKGIDLKKAIESLDARIRGLGLSMRLTLSH